MVRGGIDAKVCLGRRPAALSRHDGSGLPTIRCRGPSLVGPGAKLCKGCYAPLRPASQALCQPAEVGGPCLPHSWQVQRRAVASCWLAVSGLPAPVCDHYSAHNRVASSCSMWPPGAIRSLGGAVARQTLVTAFLGLLQGGFGATGASA